MILSINICFLVGIYIKSVQRLELNFVDFLSCACDMRVLKPTPTFSGNTVHETNRWCGYGAYIPAAVCKLLSISSISCSRKEESGPGDALISKGVERTFSAIFAFIPASTSGSSRPRL